MGIIAALVATGLAETYIQSGFAQIFGSPDRAREERERPLKDRVIRGTLGLLPVMSNITNITEFDGTGVPAWNMMLRGILGIQGVWTAETADERVRHGLNTAESLASVGGISGARVGTQIIRRLLQDDTIYETLLGTETHQLRELRDIRRERGNINQELREQVDHTFRGLRQMSPEKKEKDHYEIGLFVEH